jgi:DinB family protein
VSPDRPDAGGAFHPAIQARFDATYFPAYLRLRGQLLDVLTDADLATTLGGTTRSLGALCREIGETERSYVASFRTFRQDFDWRHPDPSIETSVERLRAWFDELDRDLLAALADLDDAAVTGRRIQRGAEPGDFDILVLEQLEIYREALVIFCGKASVYLRAMGRELPGLWAHWIE